MGRNILSWEIPDTKGRAVYRLGIALVSETRKDGSVILRTVDWSGSPKRFHMGLANELTPGISPFVIRTKWMMAFMNSTKHTGPDYLATFAISHPEKNGVMTIGTTEWDNYSVASRIQFVHAKYAAWSPGQKAIAGIMLLYLAMEQPIFCAAREMKSASSALQSINIMRGTGTTSNLRSLETNSQCTLMAK